MKNYFRVALIVLVTLTSCSDEEVCIDFTPIVNDITWVEVEPTKCDLTLLTFNDGRLIEENVNCNTGLVTVTSIGDYDIVCQDLYIQDRVCHMYIYDGQLAIIKEGTTALYNKFFY